MLKKIKYTHIPDFNERSFYFDYVQIFRNEQITIHQQKTWELSFILKGSGTRIIGDTIEQFSRNEIILIPPDIPHCWSFDETDVDDQGRIENITLTFSDQFLYNIGTTFPELKPTISRIQNYTGAVSFKGNELQELQYILKSMLTSTEIERLSLIVKIFPLLSLTDNINWVGKQTHEDKKGKRMQKILLYIMNNYQNNIKLDDIANHVELDKSSFCIFFKKMAGKTFFSYLTEYRVESSCQMIAKTNHTIAEICFMCGFRDVPYFNRTFKKIRGITPTEYRKSILAN